MKETLEEAALKYAKQFDYAEDSSPQIDFIEGAKWQQEQDKNKYSEADKIMKFLDTEIQLGLSDNKTIERIKWYFETYFEQFKKK